MLGKVHCIKINSYFFKIFDVMSKVLNKITHKGHNFGFCTIGLLYLWFNQLCNKLIQKHYDIP
jgi:hypothetical protein